MPEQLDHLEAEKIKNYSAFIKNKVGSFNTAYAVAQVDKFFTLFKQYEPKIFEKFKKIEGQSLIKSMPALYTPNYQGFEDSARMFICFSKHGLLTSSFLSPCLSMAGNDKTLATPYHFAISIIRANTSIITQAQKDIALNFIEEGITENFDTFNEKLIIHLMEFDDTPSVTSIFEKIFLQKMSGLNSEEPLKSSHPKLL